MLLNLPQLNTMCYRLYKELKKKKFGVGWQVG